MPHVPQVVSGSAKIRLQLQNTRNLTAFNLRMVFKRPLMLPRTCPRGCMAGGGRGALGASGNAGDSEATLLYFPT